MMVNFDPVTSTFTIGLDPAVLFEDEQARWRRHCRARGISENAVWVCEWIERMAAKYGGVVRGHGKAWDWGQALCVECYGPSPDDWSDDPTDADIARAVAWEAGEWPRWATARVR